MCQFLIGTVQHQKSNGGFKNENECQFLIGTVQLVPTKEYIKTIEETVSIPHRYGTTSRGYSFGNS